MNEHQKLIANRKATESATAMSTKAVQKTATATAASTSSSVKVTKPTDLKSATSTRRSSKKSGAEVVHDVEKKRKLNKTNNKSGTVFEHRLG